MCKVIFHRNAAKYYRNADKKLQSRIHTAIDTILENPRYHVHIKKLEGQLQDMYRYRLGNLRILYEIHEDLKTIRIKAIEGRDSVYK
jgi:mRNA interferase RelE/StbE